MLLFRLLLTLGCIVALSNVSFANQIYYNFHTEAREIYDLIFSLRLAEASPRIDRLQQNEPANHVTYLLEDYVDFFTIYISEEESLYDQLKGNRKKRLNILEEGDPNSPYYLYSQAEVHLHWALLRLRFEDYLGAFTDINRANKLLLRNQELFPDFIPNLKDLGVLHAAVSTVPDNLKWGIELISSLEGDLDQGQKELKQVVDYANCHPDFPFGDESRALYAYVLLHLAAQPEAAWQFMQKAGFRPQSNPLHCFVMSNIAMRTGHNDAAIAYLENRPKGSSFVSVPYLDYMQGVARLRKLDARQAKPAFQRFLQDWKGKHFRREAWQKLAWCELLVGQEAAYHQKMAKVAQEKKSSAGGDKNATREAEEATIPQLELLQARLLFDGGYYERGRNLLVNLDASRLSSERDRLEYSYRLGRLLHGLKLYNAALAYYNRTIEDGKDTPHFFACNAALQAGLIHEIKGNYEEAKTYWERCLSLQPDEYRTGLHQQAKAGLSRLR